jgi:hypothetical protein
MTVEQASTRTYERIQRAGLAVKVNDRDDWEMKQPLVFAGMDVDARAVEAWIDERAAETPLALEMLREEAPETGADPDAVPVELLAQAMARAIGVQALLFGWELAQVRP